MPFVMAGSAGGFFRTGRVVRYENEPHGNLYTAILHALGIEDPSFGDPEFCTGPSTNLT